MWQDYFMPTTYQEVLDLLAQYGHDARLIAGGTDLILEMEQGIRQPPILIDITRLPDLDTIWQDEQGLIHLGPLVTHNHVLASPLCVNHAYPLAQACLGIGSAQLRNRATVAGNLITASPANDTITPLWALDAQVVLESAERGARALTFEQFFQGVRQTALEPSEMLTDIIFAPLAENERGIFLKLGLRRAMAIAVVNVAIVLAFDGNRIERARIALGSVAPTIVRAAEAENMLAGQVLDDSIIAQAAELAVNAASPISDVRGSAAYRQRMIYTLTWRALLALREGHERESWPDTIPMLWGETNGHFAALGGETPHHAEDGGQPIETTINGQPFTIHGANDKTLLRMLREDAGLTGTKEACAEGECGSCTVFLDGVAVLSCLVPAPRAHGAQIITIEGLKQNGHLTPLQQSFVETGAIQCGYCIPGFVMAGESLLAEQPNPSREAILRAFSGNLCRCTGYYKIIEAVERTVQGR
jgi:xanthine dehydrogenase iron-sulfur cluster and FAD-binding subunit A